MLPAGSSGSKIIANIPFFVGALNQGIEWQFMDITSKTTIQWNNDFLLAA